jgi:phosphoribosyl 1,2-cyclic phosphodiesterase
MIGFCPLASGSKGNCLYVGTDKTKILIDAGLSAKSIREKLAKIGVLIEEIDAILVTHEHTDHIRGLSVLSNKWDIPICANSETAQAIRALEGDLRFKIFSTGESFVYGDMEVHPFSIQHDAVDPVGFTLKMEGIKLGICADLGFVSSLVLKELVGCDYLYVEANHEPAMVHASSRPQVYKQRVLSRLGHLSNQECAELLEEVLHPHVKHIYLAHLSSECNAPERALQIIQDKVGALGFNIPITIALQEEISQPVNFTAG